MALVCMAAASVESCVHGIIFIRLHTIRGYGRDIMDGVENQLWARRDCHWAFASKWEGEAVGSAAELLECKTLKSALMMARTSLSHIVSVRIALRIVTMCSWCCSSMKSAFTSQMLLCGIYIVKKFGALVWSSVSQIGGEREDIDTTSHSHSLERRGDKITLTTTMIGCRSVNSLQKSTITFCT